MERVLVLGCSGSGKSTFARRLAERTGLPNVSIDALYWRPGWTEPDPAAFRARMAAEVERPRWIMDGNYLRTGAGEGRLERADTIYLFDLPTIVCLFGVLRRVATGYGRSRPEMAPGCPERLDLGFLRWVLEYRAKQRPKQEAAVASLRPDQRLVRFGSRSDVKAELARLAGQAALQPA